MFKKNLKSFLVQHIILVHADSFATFFIYDDAPNA